MFSLVAKVLQLTKILPSVFSTELEIANTCKVYSIDSVEELISKDENNTL